MCYIIGSYMRSFEWKLQSKGKGMFVFNTSSLHASKWLLK